MGILDEKQAALAPWASATVDGGLAGFALPGDESRVLSARLRPERRSERRIRYEIDLHSNVDDRRTTIHFDMEAPFPLREPARADVALLTALFPALHHGGTLRIEGTVSQRLARNVLDAQAIWVRTRPDRYRPFRLEVEGTSDAVPENVDPRSVLPLSGGVDSLLALCRHTDPERPLGPSTVDLGACLFLPGFSPNPKRKDEYPAATAYVRETAARRGLPLVVAETNFSSVVKWGENAHGTLLASGLTLLAPHFAGGLIGSSVPHAYVLHPVYGSAPNVDPFYSSDGFEIRDDAGDLTRDLKVLAIGRYGDMLDRLVVCFEVEGQDGNCCRCEKCIRTMLGFIAAGHEIPKDAFPHDIEPGRVRKRLRNTLGFAQRTLHMAEARGVDHPLLRRLRRTFRYRLLKYRLRSAVTRVLPSVDLIDRDGNPPRWLVQRKTRQALGRDRGPSWR